MDFKSVSVFFFIFSLCLFHLGLLEVAASDDRKVCIVYMGSAPEKYSLSAYDHLNILNQVLEESTPEESLVRSYTRSLNGFAAMLTEREIQNLKKKKDVISVFPSRTLELQTTRSWDFLGFPESIHKGHEDAEGNTVIGVIDTGIWPESPSFQDESFGPAPKKWKGVCNGGHNFTCNNKVIGARTYTGKSARDENGHGSHTASTAAGIRVSNTSFYGIASGSVRGGTPSARIAAYKVCDSEGCKDSNILAAFDDAIADGVDMISISIGGAPSQFDMDSISIGAFHAMEKGILTIQSAGNEGSDSGTVGSVAPWIFTVAASTMDRKIVDKVVLGNGKTLVGMNVNTFTMKGDKFPFIHGLAAGDACSAEGARYCMDGCLDSSSVKGNIVVCESDGGVAEALKAGALGVVSRSNGNDDVSFISPMPAVSLDSKDFQALMSYINSTKIKAVGNILKSEAINDTSAPLVASFSSRGPNTIASDILKPDISAPGVDILAAYSPIAPVVEQVDDPRSVLYSVLSGTSMSCPHVAGVVAYLKSLHPDWSPAALRSALMTTARVMRPSKDGDDGEFEYGSGHINPIAATNPGLVYEATSKDYITFLCKSGYTSETIRKFSGDKTAYCPKKTGTNSPIDVNYPSMQARVTNGSGSVTFTFHRTVTNVGVANSTYVAKIVNLNQSGMKVTVKPDTLSFKSLKEQKSFNVTVEGKAEKIDYYSTALVWSDGIHSVRSPIVVYKYTTDDE